jgi:ataxia telangiectasia mutated family protein
MSIAGYVLGLGDRHIQNILFDKTSGEIIHIDLGIAFDQGKLLSTPELVPFRLTKNIGDACLTISQWNGH